MSNQDVVDCVGRYVETQRQYQVAALCSSKAHATLQKLREEGVWPGQIEQFNANMNAASFLLRQALGVAGAK
jgi:hypothetical protein